MAIFTCSHERGAPVTVLLVDIGLVFDEEISNITAALLTGKMENRGLVDGLYCIGVGTMLKQAQHGLEGEGVERPWMSELMFNCQQHT